MSKIGKLPINILSGVTPTVTATSVTVKGPKGELSVVVPEGIKVEQVDATLLVTRANDEKHTKSLHGLVRSLINNAIQGVAEGFTRTLEINGVGYKAEMRSDKLLVLNIGYSHPVEVNLIDGVEVKTEKNLIIVSGIDKQRVGEMAAVIRSHKKPEPYKGKGIKYSDEVIKRKAGKAAKAAG